MKAALAYRYIILTTIFFFTFFRYSTAQVVWTEPAFPTKFDDVTVYYDATQGNGALEGYQDDVYAHTGVITSESVNGNDWKHVVGNWGAADARVLMTRLDENLYSIEYNINDFYDILPGEEVYQLAFVFRNVNGTIVGRDADGSDIFTDVYPADEGLFITLRSPAGQDVIFFESDSFLIDVAVSDTADLSIYDNEDLIFQGHVDEASFYHHPMTNGAHILRIEATTDTTVNLEKEFLVLSENPVKINPPAGIVNGINYHTDSTYIFQLNAPLKDYVFLLATANQFKADVNFLMNVAEDDATFWIELPRDSFSYERNTYQYLVDGGIRIADPHSEVVLDPWNDAWIDADVMSTLPSYPFGMTDGIVTAFDTIYNPYDFEVDEFTKPAKADLVIYEMLLRDFLAAHDFETLIDTLDYFERLGVNAIELMPVNEYEGNISWGYNPSFHMAVDKYYGTREQLKKFVDEAHKRGIAVILDVVFNHTFSQGPLAQMYWDATNFRPSAESPYLNVVARHPFNVGYDFNHESKETKEWVKRILGYWVTEFKFDGFRFDLSKGLTQFFSGGDAGLMSRYDAGRIAILKDYADYIWELDPKSYVIMEHFADNDEEIELSSYGMMLWGNMNHAFSQAAKGFSSDLEWADYTVRGWEYPHLISYMESHDEERLMVRILNEGDSEGDYNTRELPTALERVAAAATIFYSIPGPKMLWQFGEMGYDYSINHCVNGTIANECRLDPKPIRWDYLQEPDRERLFQVVSALIHLKTNYATFSTDSFVFNDGNFFLKTVHLYHPDMDAVTLANFRVINSDINPKFPRTGIWYEYFTGDSLVVTDTQEKLPFLPGEYRIYTSERISPPEGFITSTGETHPKHVYLYPNPAGSGDWIYGAVRTEASINTIILSSLQGVQYEVPYEQFSDGEFRFRLPEKMPAGFYAVFIRTKSEYFTTKVIKQE